MSGSRAKRAVRALLFLVCFVVAWLGLVVRVAEAQPRHTAIALVSGGADAELHARLRAELAGLGWRVKEMGLGGDLALAQVARRAGTLAVLRVGRAAEGIEVWVAPEVDSEARSEWIDVDARRPELAVLRAVEALRARFLELGIEPEDTRGEASGSDSTPPESTSPPTPSSGNAKRGNDARPGESKPAPEIPADEPGELGPDDYEPPPPRPPQLPLAPQALWLSLSGGVISASKQLAPGASVSGAVRVVHESWLGVDLSGWWSPVAASVSGAQGYADVRAGLVALGGEVRDRRGSWTLAAGGGAALAWLSVSGHSIQGYRGQSAAALTAMPFARVAAEVALVRRLNLRAEGMLGFTAQRVHVLFEQTTVATWGRPLLAGTLGLEWAALGD
jgi:hypothetical protein